MNGLFVYHFCLIFISLVITLSSATWTIQVQRLNDAEPVISSLVENSAYNYTYNPSWVPGIDGPDGLLVRCQNITSKTNVHIVGPSVMAYVHRVGKFDESGLMAFENITEGTVVFQPATPQEALGTEDPYLVYREEDQTYYLYYVAVQRNTTIKQGAYARLSLATTKNISDPNSWIRYGDLFPELPYWKTCSGALLLRDDANPKPKENKTTHFLIFGDTGGYNPATPGLMLATTTDLIHYTVINSSWITTRNDSFDSFQVAGGPYPMRLSDGNYLYLYNSARLGYPSPLPNYAEQYNVGFLILDQDDPTRILQRSDEPILTPQMDWEIGSSPNLDNTPNTVFLNGWQPDPLGRADTFVAYYGAADSVCGSILIQATKNS